MSKKSVVARGFGWKLAAAAVAVAGVLGLTGVAWATPNTVSEVDNATATIDFDFNFTGSLEFVSHNPTLQSLSNIDVITAPNATTVTNPGNLGHLEAETNGPSWDIEFTTLFGGRLYSRGDYVTHVCNQNPFTGETTCDTTWSAGLFLLYNTRSVKTNDADSSRIHPAGADPDTVILDMAIGLASAFAQGSPSFGSIYPLGAQEATPKYVRPTRIGPELLKESGTDLDCGLTMGGDAISFAERFATDAATGTSESQGINTALGGLSGFAGLGSLSATVGSVTTLGTTGFRAVNDKQYFYINAGIHPDNVDIAGTANRKYSETITFSLKAGF